MLIISYLKIKNKNTIPYIGNMSEIWNVNTIKKSVKDQLAQQYQHDIH